MQAIECPALCCRGRFLASSQYFGCLTRVRGPVRRNAMTDPPSRQIGIIETVPKTVDDLATISRSMATSPLAQNQDRVTVRLSSNPPLQSPLSEKVRIPRPRRVTVSGHDDLVPRGLSAARARSPPGVASCSCRNTSAASSWILSRLSRLSLRRRVAVRDRRTPGTCRPNRCARAVAPRQES